MKRIARAFLDSIFPPKCLVCGSLEGMRFPEGSRSARAGGSLSTASLCRRCEAELVAIDSPLCPRCGIPFVSGEGPDHHCLECLTENRYFRKARSFGVYGGVLMKAIHVFKYGRKTVVSRRLGQLVRDSFHRHWKPDEVDLLLAVPLHRKRLRERGFNQAHLLITRWAKAQEMVFDDALLTRHRMTEPQAGLSLHTRKGNVKGAFIVQKPELVKGRRILLIDDVYTTGATVNECAKSLMKAGAEYVDILTLARAL